MTLPITKAQALEALDNLDDFARMETGIYAHGPTETLRKYIEQQSQTPQLEAPISAG